ncbi:MAG: hypothetical protein DRR42_23530 [Gammaproteobacteria bacterium]|nr:MAG: hypothetical protein DRR42_23530 [Gammaproteobacteria bacterium]
MALKLSDLLKGKPCATIETSIGMLCLFSISVGSQSKLLKSLSAPIEETDPREYLKKLLIYVCYPENDLKDGKYKPDNPILTLEGIDEFSDQELEALAKAYVSSNEYLFKKSELRKKKGTDGKPVHYSNFTETEHPRQDEENYIEYLHRLSCLEKDKQKESMERILGSMPKLDSFSKALSGGITKNLMLGESISNSIESSRVTPGFEFTPSRLDSIDMGEMQRNIERVRKEPFDDLAQRLDKLINSSIQASEFMVEANRIQTEIATEIKAGGDTTDRHARNNIKLSWGVIILTISGLIMSGWTISSGVSFSEDQQRALENYTSNLSESIIFTTKAVEESGNESEIVLKEILSELSNLNENLVINRESLGNIYREIDSLKISNEEYKREVEELKGEIEELRGSN